MRKPMVAGNWKMNKTVKEACELVTELLPLLSEMHAVERVLCPPATSLFAISAMLEKTEIGLGAQNLYWEASGAYTGELSPAMVRELCRYVIIGHSERRTLFGETDEQVNKKLRAAINAGLIPIVCIGETLEQYEAGLTAGVIMRQVKEGMGGFTAGELANLVIAYEPVWAIGTGKASSAEGANQVVAEYIRPALADMYGQDFAQQVRVLYGGSVKGENAAEFFAMPDIDGALVGGASLKSAEFAAITSAADKKKVITEKGVGMKVLIDADLCIACGVCESICPEVFRVTDIAHVQLDPVPEEYRGKVNEAIGDCPTEAISIAE